ncbi:hypothetical protein [Rhodococcus sp. no. 34]
MPRKPRSSPTSPTPWWTSSAHPRKSSYLQKPADTGTAKQLRKLINQVSFGRNERGTAALRDLGDALVTELLRP